MNELFKSYKEFDAFIKMQLLVMLVISLSWALIVPILIKLQGTLWATYIIAGYGIIQSLSTFLMPMFKKLTVKEAYRTLIILDFLYLASLSIYFWSPIAFLYTEACLMVIYGLIMNVFGINYDAFLMERYKTDIFKDIQYVERMVVAFSAILGSSIVALVDILSSSIKISLLVFMVILTINLLFQLHNYKYHWSVIFSSD